MTDSPHAGGADRLVELDQDHPGFRDPDYRARRNTIARVALDYVGGPVPEVPYTEDEHAVWVQVWDSLDSLHEAWAPRGFLVLHKRLGLDRRRIPQLEVVNQRLMEVCGFRMLPVAGLIQARTFLSYLAEGVFLSTQYIRHHSVPLYTPEPDVVHELIGHAASFTHPMIVELNRAFGRAARVADDAGIERLERAYWWTMEFGALREGGAVKAFGAGLLSSFGELGSFAVRAELRPFDLPQMAATTYDPTNYQPVIYVADSWEEMYYELAEWLAAEEAR
jgi:phenylalanine-4-hydroxylase